MERPKRQQIRVAPSSHASATKAAAACGLSLSEYTEATLGYFTSRQLNPVGDVAREGELIMLQVKKLGDRIFSYMQEEERSLLVPMLEEMLRSRVTLDRVLRMNEILVANLNRQLGTMTKEQIESQREAGKQLRAQNEEMIERQVQEAIAGAKKAGPGKPKAEGQAGKNDAELSR
ncbi:hypothetical protein BEN47_11680 [Hymenobacter lapidarius]|uniref:Uncharacterized protein n=1 Tax=Hymenobacter lapidarius TaxID=1908237 RepID=A0A1G1T8H6_9BACT|nr:BfmA/BtgA family mobilization protein [Hymenobacter lapidarius]OGX87134.1 hypothetical protein BEN47_11680 [Hymenobacter lapidarius]